MTYPDFIHYFQVRNTKLQSVCANTRIATWLKFSINTMSCLPRGTGLNFGLSDDDVEDDDDDVDRQIWHLVERV